MLMYMSTASYKRHISILTECMIFSPSLRWLSNNLYTYDIILWYNIIYYSSLRYKTIDFNIQTYSYNMIQYNTMLKSIWHLMAAPSSCNRINNNCSATGDVNPKMISLIIFPLVFTISLPFYLRFYSCFLYDLPLSVIVPPLSTLNTF